MDKDRQLQTGSLRLGGSPARPPALRVPDRGWGETVSHSLPALGSKTDFSSVRPSPERQGSGSLSPPAACELSREGQPGTEKVAYLPTAAQPGEGLNHQGSSGAKPLPSGHGGPGGLEWGAANSWVLGPARIGPGLSVMGVTGPSLLQPATAL